MSFIIINLFLVLAIFFLFILLSWVWPPDSPWSPWWKTDKRMSRILCKLAGVGEKDVMYELGSGNGTTLIIAAREFGVKKAVGIEVDLLRYWISQYFNFLHRLQKKVTFLRKSFFDVDISEATIVYVYLVPKALKKLEKKFLKELKPGTRIVSLVYPIPYLLLIKEDKKNKFMVYEIPKK